MDCNTTLNIACDFNGYLVCQMPANTVEMELKIKTMRGEYTLHKDTCTRRERYHLWDRADKGSKIHTKRRTAREVESEIASNSETDIQMSKGFVYPPEIFTNPEFAKTIPLTDMDSEEVEVTNHNFIRKFCTECVKKYKRYRSFKSDWEEDLVDVETPRVLTKSNNSQQLTVTVMLKRQPPPAWAEFRRCITKKNKDNDPIDKLIIKGYKIHIHARI